MKKIYPSIFIIFIIIFSCVCQAAEIKFLCPNNTPIKQGTQCNPEKCFSDGISFDINGIKFSKRIGKDGTVKISDEFLGKLAIARTGSNYWKPAYCEHLNGAGYLTSRFVVKKNQNLIMIFHQF